MLESDRKVIETLARFLIPPFNQPIIINTNSSNNNFNMNVNSKLNANFRRACANLIKKYYYTVAQAKNIDKQPYIQLVY